MTDKINIFAPELRNKVHFELQTIKGAWVEFFDDLSGSQLSLAQRFNSTDALTSDKMEASYDLLASMIGDWNFYDAKEKLEISAASLKKVPLKSIKELSDLMYKAMNMEAESGKKKD